MSLRMRNRIFGERVLDGDPAAASAGGGSLVTPTTVTPPPKEEPADPAPAVGDWRASLPKEMQEDATIKKYNSVEALAGAYLNAQKLIGGDKIPVPTKHSTEEDWKNVYKKLGLPEKIEEYSVKFKDGISIDDKFANDFKALAHSKGILPAQAQALADWFSDVNAGSEKAVVAEKAKMFETTVTNLKKEWGNAFDLQVARANKVIHEAGGDELANHFATSGFGADEKVLKFLAKIGQEMYGEHKFVEGQSGGAGPMTPKEIEAEIQKLLKEPAYFDGGHPNHKKVVEEVKSLYEQKYTVDKK